MKSMRKTVFLLLFVLLLGVFAGCSSGKDSLVPAGFRKVSPDGVGFTLYVPSDWTPDISTGVTTAYVSEKDRSNVSMMAFELSDAVIQVNTAGGTETAAGTSAVTDKDDIVTAADYWSYYAGILSGTFGDLRYETEGENLLLSGMDAKKYVYTAAVTGTEYKFMQVVAVKNGTVYLFTYTAAAEKYDSHLEEVLKTVEYIAIEG